jgi:tetratricopeptide (TPR) repeat protein/predicted Ser/Thr protein kinase
MEPQRRNSRGNLVDTLRSGTSSIRAALSQLATRRKTPESPATPAAHKPVPEGPRWGQLVLLDKVGEGAFGEVHRAWDVVLEREVALKLMRASEEDPALLQEARMLARLRHRNVVTVYGVDRHDGRSGVWMDFIEGETLAAIVEQRGAFGALEAILVGVDVCGALAAAHQSGLLHRDIKAQNVMRERGGRIVLMDFGLGHETAAGEPTDFGGTPLYMAPELLEGGPATVRSDLYAVGVLLFHLVTRAYPVEGSSIAELRKAHSDGEARSLRDLRPDLASSFTRVVEKAFDHEPSHRYATAGQMTAALEGALGRRRLALPVSRRAFWWTATSAAASGAAAIWYRTQRPSTAVTAGASLLLSEIANATGDAQLSAVGDVLRVQLAQSAHFNLLDSDRVKETLVRMTRPADQKMDLPVVREVALRSATPLVVYGTVSPLGTGYNLSLVIERIEGQPRTPATTESKLFEARNKVGMFDAIHQAATWIRQTAGEAGKDISANDTLPEEATTSNWEALDFFAKGERLLPLPTTADAVTMYKEAVRVDSGFALALARITQAQSTLQHRAEAFEYLRKTTGALKQRHVTQREELRIRSMQAIMTEDFVAAEQSTKLFTLTYPGDHRAHHNHAEALRNLDRLEEAREEFLASRRLRLTDAVRDNLVLIGLLRGQKQEVAGNLKDLPPALATYLGSFLKFLDRDFMGCETALRAVIHEDRPFRSVAYGALASLFGERGRAHEALAILDEGTASDALEGNATGRGLKLLASAHLHFLAGERGTAKGLAQEATQPDSDTECLRRAGCLLAQAGFLPEARAILARLNVRDEGHRSETARMIVAAEIDLAEGRKQKALDGFDKAAALAPPIHPRDFLARAWERAGEIDKALIAWRRIAHRPELVWSSQPGLHPPGLWTEALLRVAALSQRVGQLKAGGEALALFLKIRERADTNSPQSEAAQRLLKQYM